MSADEDVSDTEWLARAVGGRARPILGERAAVIAFEVQTCCLTNGHLRAAVMAEEFLVVIEQLEARCREPGLFLYAVSGVGTRHIER